MNRGDWLTPETQFDKLAPSTAKEEPLTGVEGDPTKATAELGKMFIGWKIDNAVNQIHEFLAQKK